MSTKHFRIILLATFALLAILGFANPVTSYAAASPIGVANYQQILNQHPDMAQANEIYKAAIKQAQDDFNAKSPSMSDQDKRAYSQQLEQGLQQKKSDLLNAIREKVNAAIKEVADAKGLTIVVDKTFTIYGGQDITDDVLKKIMGK